MSLLCMPSSVVLHLHRSSSVLPQGMVLTVCSPWATHGQKSSYTEEEVQSLLHSFHPERKKVACLAKRLPLLS